MNGWNDNGEWTCPKGCGVSIGKNLNDEMPFALVAQHECAKPVGEGEPIIPEIPMDITMTEIKASTRRLEHKDGSPILWPKCLEPGGCPLNECRPVNTLKVEDIG